MITQRIRHGEVIIDLGPDVALVASKTEPGRWHRVTPESCDCKGFQYRSTCRHLGVVFPAVLMCEHCGSLIDLVIDTRFIAGIGQIEEVRCRDLIGCDQRQQVTHKQPA